MSPFVTLTPEEAEKLISLTCYRRPPPRRAPCIPAPSASWTLRWSLVDDNKRHVSVTGSQWGGEGRDRKLTWVVEVGLVTMGLVANLLGSQLGILEGGVGLDVAHRRVRSKLGHDGRWLRMSTFLLRADKLRWVFVCIDNEWSCKESEDECWSGALFYP